MIYLDNAATSWPKPEIVYRTMDEFLRTRGGNPGRGSHSMAVSAGQAVDEARLLLARLINATQVERVIFTLNCTDALNLGLKGLLRPGDHVITSCIGHNSLVRPLNKLERQGVQVTRVPPAPQTGVLSPHDIENAITSRTRLLAVTHASNVTGIIQPVEEYGALARKHELVFMVDAAQTAGNYQIDVQAANIDLLAIPGHKATLGPPGTGALYMGDRVELETLREGGTGTHSESEEQPLELPYRYECGTVNSLGIAGLGAGLKFIAELGLDRIRNHEKALTAKLIEGLSEIPLVKLYSAGDPARQAPVVSFNIEGYEPGEVGAILDQAFGIKVRAGLHCAPAVHRTIGTFPIGTVRISPGYFNTEADIEFALDAIRTIAGTQSPR